jgi:glycosyltransferase involved in cell wall biosynthesis
MRPELSVVVPVRNGEATLGECLRGLRTQSLAADRYEVIVVDDGSTDRSAAIAAEHATTVIRRRHAGGAAAARNAGWQEAQGRWVAFTDADCLPTRTWLAAFDAVLTRDPESALGAAGRTLGYESETDAARFADLIGSLDAERHLAHPVFPFAPSANVLYRRDALEAAGGFDERFRTYEACDLHTRLIDGGPARFEFVPRAVVLHRHRDSWRGYWRQQRGYGEGYAQFVWRYRDRLPWSNGDELRAWVVVGRAGLAAARGGGDADERLVRRGMLVKLLAQRVGFDATFWRRTERGRW